MQDLSKKFRKGARTVNAQLKRLVNSGDNSHYTLEDRRPEEFEVIEGIGVLLRVRLKERTPPLFIRFKCENKNKYFRVFYSYELREPTENNNHGSTDVNVSIRRYQFDSFVCVVAQETGV